MENTQLNYTCIPQPLRKIKAYNNYIIIIMRRNHISTRVEGDMLGSEALEGWCWQCAVWSDEASQRLQKNQHRPLRGVWEGEGQPSAAKT